VPIEPRLLAGLRPSSPGVRLDALVIAVVVNGDGKAYSVAAVNPPQNMGESVLLTSALSVVKGWRFAPATKDGAPVKYRLTVPLRAVTGP
jgi:outer membrane biosynthesis protein TonB